VARRERFSSSPVTTTRASASPTRGSITRSHTGSRAYDSSIGCTVYDFNFKNAVDWASNLKVLAPGQQP